MTVRNNEVIGTVECNVCHQVASVHQVERGGRKGMLYIRGCDCVINQSTGAPFQNYWRENTRPREGFEYLFPGKDTSEPCEVDQVKTETEEPPCNEGSDQEAQVKEPGIVPVVVGGALILLTGFAAIIGLSK